MFRVISAHSIGLKQSMPIIPPHDGHDLFIVLLLYCLVCSLGGVFDYLLKNLFSLYFAYGINPAVIRHVTFKHFARIIFVIGHFDAIISV
jgi:hypothetical protein